MQLQTGTELTADTELVVSQVVPSSPMSGTLDEFVNMVFDGRWGPEGEPPRGVLLGVEKFRLGYGRKSYGLIWIGRRKAWLAAEQPQRFRRKGDAVLAGQALAEEKGVSFDERTR
jgi:hypothetical protein